MIKKNEELAIIKNIILNLLCKKSTVFNWKVSLLLFVLNDKKILSQKPQISEDIHSTNHNIHSNDQRRKDCYLRQ